jgi:hypothetical protein
MAVEPKRYAFRFGGGRVDIDIEPLGAGDGDVHTVGFGGEGVSSRRVDNASTGGKWMDEINSAAGRTVSVA